MIISKEQLKTFKDIWRNQFKEEISDDVALEGAVRLLGLIEAVYRPIKKEWLEEYDKLNSKNNDMSSSIVALPVLQNLREDLKL